MEHPTHIPVLLNEVIAVLNPQPGQVVIDATINGGGHARAILERIGSAGKLLGIDRDCGLIQTLAREMSERSNIHLVCANFAEIASVAKKLAIYSEADAILFDLGFSSYHMEASGRGFSLSRDEPLDMRYDPEGRDVSASDIVNEWPPEEIARILREYGEERYAERIARRIILERSHRRITTSKQLAALIHHAVPRGRNRIDPATRTFQALRIAVNDEFTHIRAAFAQVPNVLKKGGILAVISFHSLEDRIVKHTFREWAEKGVAELLTKKPIIATREEIKKNPRSRSAKLRTVKIIS